jgi:hypothetical protein
MFIVAVQLITKINKKHIVKTDISEIVLIFHNLKLNQFFAFQLA